MRRTLFLLIAVASVAALGARSRPAIQAPTFSRDVARILQQHCQECHNPEGMAPFSLMTYQEVAPRAAQIAAVTAAGLMPMWKPAPDCGEFVGERRMTRAEIKTLGAWVIAGVPEGRPADLPAPKNFGSNSWKLGSPDLITAMSEPYDPPTTGDSFRCFVLPVATGNGLNVSGVDFRPGARENVHHILAYVDTSGTAERLDAEDPGPGYECMGGPRFQPAALLGGWFPGAEPFVLPPGIATRVESTSRVVTQVHYHPHHGHIEADRTEMAMYLANEPVTKTLRYGAAENVSFTIPAGATGHRIQGSVAIPANITIYAIGGHMHLLGQTMNAEAVLPDGSRQCLLKINHWDPAWQGMYVYRQPVSLPLGTTITVEASYDNSMFNPRNPNQPPRDVSWGEEAYNEMLSAYFAYTVDE